MAFAVLMRRRPLVLAVLAAVVGLVAFVLVWFEPQALLFDETASEARPAGAVPLAVATVPTSTVAPSSETTEPMVDPAAPAPAPTTEAPDPVVPEPEPEPTAAPVLPTQFVSLDHGTSGTVSVLVGLDGTRFVRFEGLDTDNGPDLKVYLSANPHDGPEAAFDDDIVDLGSLTANKGDQNYAIDGDVDLSRFASVVIWCDRFNSAFGAAPLPG